MLVNCKTGCSQTAVIAALRERGLWDQDRTAGQPGQPVALYRYIAPDGTPVAIKGRFEGPQGKTFLWRRPNSERWTGLEGLRMADMPLFRADRIAAAPVSEPVYFVEGEKAALACEAHGLLAVCQGGGAAAREIGGLEVLQGHPVRLWPDNDPPGYALMGRVGVALRGIAASIEVVNVPLPERGDAWDWFAAGGTVEGITVEASASAPGVEFLDEDVLRVRVLGDLGPVSLYFAGVTVTRREWSAEVDVRLLGPGAPSTTYSERINLLSSSQRTDMRRDLEGIYGKEHGWPRVLNEAFHQAREAWRAVDRAVDVSTIVDPGPESMLVTPLVPVGVPSVLFGDAGAGKTYEAQSLMLHGALGEVMPGMAEPAHRFRSIFVDYEGTEAVFWRRMRRLALGMGLDGLPAESIYYWDARGTPLPDLVETLRRTIGEKGIDLVVVDSAGEACGGEPEQAVIALTYFRSLAQLRCTSITIAHLTHAAAAEGKRPQAPYGNRYWRHTPRRLWYAQSAGETMDPNRLEVGLFCVKPGDGVKPQPVGLVFGFDGTPDGPVTVEATDVRRVPELATQLPAQQRIISALSRGPRTTKELVDELGLSRSTVTVTLSRLANRVVKAGDGWRLPYSE